MPRRLNLPDSASVAVPDAEGRLFAPSAARNSEVITNLVSQIAPPAGRALELASGTGQHICALARAMPHLDWQPSEIDASRRDSINAYTAASRLGNIAPAIALDATQPGWGGTQSGTALILLCNLLHLISTPEAHILIHEAAQALSPNGTLAIYGPFMRQGQLTSPGDKAFHASLQRQDPEIGYKDESDVIDWGRRAGLTHMDTIDMPANNLTLIWKRPI